MSTTTVTPSLETVDAQIAEAHRHVRLWVTDPDATKVNPLLAKQLIDELLDARSNLTKGTT